MERPSRVAAPLLALALLVAAPAPGTAQANLGVQGAVSSEYDFGVGARALAQMEDMNFDFVGSFDYFMPDGPGDAWDLNAEILYHFHVSGTHSMIPYLGGGLNVTRLTAGEGQTDAGLNLGGGIRFPLTNVTPFLEGRAVISDREQAVVTVGLLFGHAHIH